MYHNLFKSLKYASKDTCKQQNIQLVAELKSMLTKRIKNIKKNY